MKQKWLALILTFALALTGAACAAAPEAKTETAPETEAVEIATRAFRVRDLAFSLPEEFQEGASDGTDGTEESRVFFAPGQKAAQNKDKDGVEVSVFVLEAESELADWVMNWSNAARLQLKLYRKTIGGADFIIASSESARYYYAKEGGAIYEVILSRFGENEENAAAAKKILEETMAFTRRAPALEETVTAP